VLRILHGSQVHPQAAEELIQGSSRPQIQTVGHGGQGKNLTFALTNVGEGAGRNPIPVEPPGPGENEGALGDRSRPAPETGANESIGAAVGNQDPPGSGLQEEDEVG
jgi:hypothetical protein